MKQILTALILFLSIPGFANIETLEYANLIEVSGSGRAEAMPNMATLYVSVNTFAKTAKEAQAANSLESKKMVKALKKKFPFGARDITTSDYSVNPRYDTSREKVLGYDVKHAYSIVVKDIEKLGEVIDVAGANGADDIDYIRFGISNTKPLANEALKSAMQDARENAEVIAASAGRPLKQVVKVSYVDYEYHGSEQQMEEEPSGPTEIIPGMISITADVTVEYEI